jgi:hypothetical protein
MNIDTPLNKLGEVPLAALRDMVLALDIIRPHRDTIHGLEVWPFSQIDPLPR